MSVNRASTIIVKLFNSNGTAKWSDYDFINYWYPLATHYYRANFSAFTWSQYQSSVNNLWNAVQMVWLVLATNRDGSRKFLNQFDLWQTESSQDFRLKPHHFSPIFQTKISKQVLVRSTRLSFYLVVNFIRYQIKKKSSRSDKNSLTHFRSKILVREPVCDEPAEIRKYRIKSRIESMLGSIRHEPIWFVANIRYCINIIIFVSIDYQQHSVHHFIGV
jgi:hypothetical protein